MRRIFIVVGLAVVILVGCVQKADESPAIIGKTETKTKDVEKVDIARKVYEADQSTFHFVGDWLSDSKIVFVEKDLGLYLVKTFDVETGEVELLYEDPFIITDVLIHPSKEYILLHTSDNPNSAVIKVLSIDGVIHNEISIESSELAIEWNNLDPSLILFTAFDSDWTFDTFLYNGKDELFTLVEIDGPFPKWYGTKKIITGYFDEHELDSGTLVVYNTETGSSELTDIANVVYFDTYEESILVVRIDDENNAIYTIMDLDGLIASEWKMPAVSNYSEWVFQKVTWDGPNRIFLPAPEESGELDDLTSPYHLTSIVDGQQEVLVKDITPSVLRCSPDGEKCLTGYASEKLIDLKTKEEIDWIQFRE
ncbi:hypothetical protein [Sporosarcina sp. G11-34]|uniref:YqgU-like beta propeller domain-containing protein n=1 Tax=Sporosarcina sp. G11-34 TaxID=2849605 RepID=UPI0022A98D3D|nr:hypothetical protein [Sporosarcina sp. G11-34]MCZ2260073.1 hypothetical protein [Sporosarcina sp. G11-34]